MCGFFFWHLDIPQVLTLLSEIFAAELRKENLSILWRTWSDVARTYESEDGQNSTDMTFFAIAPAATRPKGQNYSTLPSSSFVPFPAVRSPNYFDTIDVLPDTDALKFMAKNRAGVVILFVVAACLFLFSAFFFCSSLYLSLLSFSLLSNASWIFIECVGVLVLGFPSELEPVFGKHWQLYR